VGRFRPLLLLVVLKELPPSKFDFPLNFLDHFDFFDWQSTYQPIHILECSLCSAYQAQQCFSCHSVHFAGLPSESSAGNTKPDIFLVTSIYKEETLCSFLLPLMLSHKHNVPQFSWQPLAAFGSRFKFPDSLKFNTLDHLQRLKTVSSTNLRQLFPRLPACC
jgi:hypothetical protein